MVLTQTPSEDYAHFASGDYAKRLLRWYDAHRRDLPWRARPGQTCDPYAVWLSEIMLQQTTVAAVRDYYRKFLSRWPTVRALAEASDEAVMQAWAGLGYYARARNLLACARLVAHERQGIFPDCEEDLRTLPGVGTYTAAAIAAIAFDRRAVVVDGNLERISARLTALATPPKQSRAMVWAIVNALTPHQRCGDFAQGMMDLGAMVCTPRNPTCALCPFHGHCAAEASGTPELYPVKPAKPKRPQRFGAVFYVRDAQGRILTRKRPPKGLLGGMTEFPGSSWGNAPDENSWSQAEPIPADYIRATTPVIHVFTHFALTMTVFAAQIDASPAPEGCNWTADTEMEHAALPTLMRKAAQIGAKALDKPPSD